MPFWPICGADYICFQQVILSSYFSYVFTHYVELTTSYSPTTGESLWVIMSLFCLRIFITSFYYHYYYTYYYYVLSDLYIKSLLTLILHVHVMHIQLSLTAQLHQQSVNSQWLSQWEGSIFDLPPPKESTSFNRLPKICHRWLRPRLLQLCKI